MGRATIPYEDIKAKLEAMFPWPTYRTVRLRKPDRYNDIKAPTTVYDRSTGNYARAGYKCHVTLERFVGVSEDLTQTLWKQERQTVMVEV